MKPLLALVAMTLASLGIEHANAEPLRWNLQNVILKGTVIPESSSATALTLGLVILVGFSGVLRSKLTVLRDYRSV